MNRIRSEFFAPPDDFDRLFGVETRRTVWRMRLGIGPDDHGYQAVDPGLFRRAVDYVPRDTFIDLGCGKGRGMILAHQAGFSRLIGIELSHPLAGAARRNADHLGIRANVVECNAAEYALPPEPCVVFMYNPFGLKVLTKVVNNLRSHPFPVHVIYVVPEHKALFSDFREIYAVTSLLVCSRP